jgi:hypothetical protein
VFAPGTLLFPDRNHSVQDQFMHNMGIIYRTTKQTLHDNVYLRIYNAISTRKELQNDPQTTRKLLSLTTEPTSTTSPISLDPPNYMDENASLLHHMRYLTFSITRHENRGNNYLRSRPEQGGVNEGEVDVYEVDILWPKGQWMPPIELTFFITCLTCMAVSFATGILLGLHLFLSKFFFFHIRLLQQLLIFHYLYSQSRTNND